ncbi:hypothetical protein [Nannocystis punicea]|uniref:Uncharacterized protein n=1 Tax=Nannocystis punicea TaxID=2995304 RepID=A0ABY7GXS7_9BACT|nr:hypothetical protein [Nannocystis poenicansa]WAS91785.1 hypothetical protein O0S08_36850 [Nannocystis poenicansa]
MNFFTRISLSIPAIVLVALVAPGCVLHTKVGANPVDGSDTDGSSSSDPGETETGAGETETGASETETSAGETETGGPAPTDSATTGFSPSACEAPDPAAQASVTIDFGDWPIDVDTYPEEKHISAGDCAVQSVADGGGTIDIALRCSEGELVDMPIALRVTGPADFIVEVVVGDAVELAAFWKGDGIDIVGGSWFTLRGANKSLLLAGLDLDVADRPQANLAPLTIEVDDNICEPLCEPDCANPNADLVERLGLVFTHEGGPSFELLDENRGQLLAGGERYDIVVGQAEIWTCINCGPRYRWIVRQADQE